MSYFNFSYIIIFLFTSINIFSDVPLSQKEKTISSLDFPIQPAKAILSKYVKDKELANCITIDSQKIHWRNRYKKIGIKYFSSTELEDLVVTVNSEGLLTYKGIPLVVGSYSYILSKEGKLLAFLRKTPQGKNINTELTKWFKQKIIEDSSLFIDVSTKEPLFYKVVCKHSSLSHGDNVLAVGDFQIDTEGVPFFFDNSSGHYRLKSISMKNLAYYLHTSGVKDTRFYLFYKNEEKKIRKRESTLLEVLNAPDDSPLFNAQDLLCN